MDTVETYTNLKNRFEQLTALINVELANWDARTLPGMQVQREKYKQELTKLTKSLKAFLKQNSLGIILTGSKAKEFADVVIDKKLALSQNFDELYERLSAKTYPVGYEYSLGHISLITDELGSIFSDLVESGDFSLDNIPTPKPMNMGTSICKSFQNQDGTTIYTKQKDISILQGLIRKSVEEGLRVDNMNPDSLAVAYSEAMVYERALKEDIAFESIKVLPVVLYGNITNPSFVQKSFGSLVSKNIVLDTTDMEISEAEVFKALLNARAEQFPHLSLPKKTRKAKAAKALASEADVSLSNEVLEEENIDNKTT